ncbi:unnamed protein product [Diamesa serratosioi]
MVLGINKFLFCLDLESGGVFIGWVGIIVAGILLGLLTISMFFATAAIGYITSHISRESEEEKVIRMLQNSAYGRYKRDLHEQGNEYLKNVPEFSAFTSHDNNDVMVGAGVGLGVIIGIAVLCYAFLILRMWGYVSLLNGTNRRNHRQVLVYVIIDAIFLVLTVIPALIFSFDLSTVVFDIIWIYLSVCTFSLYKKLENESKQRTGLGAQYELSNVGIAPNYQPQGPVVYTQVPGYQQPQIGYPQVPAYQQPQLEQVPNDQKPKF